MTLFAPWKYILCYKGFFLVKTQAANAERKMLNNKVFLSSLSVGSDINKIGKIISVLLRFSNLLYNIAPLVCEFTNLRTNEKTHIVFKDYIKIENQSFVNKYQLFVILRKS